MELNVVRNFPRLAPEAFQKINRENQRVVGVPDNFITDNGPQFASAEFSVFNKSLDV